MKKQVLNRQGNGTEISLRKKRRGNISSRSVTHRSSWLWHMQQCSSENTFSTFIYTIYVACLDNCIKAGSAGCRGKTMLKRHKYRNTLPTYFPGCSNQQFRNILVLPRQSGHMFDNHQGTYLKMYVGVTQCWQRWVVLHLHEAYQ